MSRGSISNRELKEVAGVSPAGALGRGLHLK